MTVELLGGAFDGQFVEVASDQTSTTLTNTAGTWTYDRDPTDSTRAHLAKFNTAADQAAVVSGSLIDFKTGATISASDAHIASLTVVPQATLNTLLPVVVPAATRIGYDSGRVILVRGTVSSIADVLTSSAYATAAQVAGAIAVAEAIRAMIVADSIGLGRTGDLGGWRPEVAAAAMRDADKLVEFVGPIEAHGMCRCVSGQMLIQIGFAIVNSGFQADVQSYAPDLVVIAEGANDILSAVSLADMQLARSLIAAALRALRPGVTMLWVPVVKFGAIYAAFEAPRVAWNADLDSYVAANPSDMLIVPDFGSGVALNPAPDDLHPTTPAGYDTMAGIITPSMVAAINFATHTR